MTLHFINERSGKGSTICWLAILPPFPFPTHQPRIKGGGASALLSSITTCFVEKERSKMRLP